MKKLKEISKKMFAGILLSIILLSLNMSAVNAASVSPSMNNHKLIYGINHFNYYITDSVLNHSKSSMWISLINDAVNSWVDTGYGWNPLYAYRTYDPYISAMDISLTEQSIEGHMKGNIYYFLGDSSNKTQVDPWSNDWVFTEVELFVKMYDWNDYNRMQRYIAYFFGRTFGLDTNKDSNSVMCSFYTTCNVYKPSLADHNGLNAIYNN